MRHGAKGFIFASRPFTFGQRTRNNEKDLTSKAIYHDLVFFSKIGNGRLSTFTQMIRFICNQSLVIILFSRCENLPYLLGHFDLITNFIKYWFVQLFFEMSNIPRTGSVVFTDTLVNNVKYCDFQSNSGNRRFTDLEHCT